MTTMNYVAPRVRFRCTLCGECCKRYWIPVTHVDVFRIAEYSGLSPEQFVTFFDKEMTTGWDYPEIRLANGRYYMILAKRPDGSCIFNRYAENGRLICSVHPVKPLVCRFYPFVYWVKDDVVYFEVLDKAIGYCPGLGRGSYHEFSIETKAVEEIRRAKEEYRRIVSKWNRLVEKHVVEPTPQEFLKFLGTVYEARRLEENEKKTAE